MKRREVVDAELLFTWNAFCINSVRPSLKGWPPPEFHVGFHFNKILIGFHWVTVTHHCCLQQTKLSMPEGILFIRFAVQNKVLFSIL